MFLCHILESSVFILGSRQLGYSTFCSLIWRHFKDFGKTLLGFECGLKDLILEKSLGCLGQPDYRVFSNQVLDLCLALLLLNEGANFPLLPD
jgi:hypothetical protein